MTANPQPRGSMPSEIPEPLENDKDPPALYRRIAQFAGRLQIENSTGIQESPSEADVHRNWLNGLRQA